MFVLEDMHELSERVEQSRVESTERQSSISISLQGQDSIGIVGFEESKIERRDEDISRCFVCDGTTDESVG